MLLNPIKKKNRTIKMTVVLMEPKNLEEKEKADLEVIKSQEKEEIGHEFMCL